MKTTNSQIKQAKENTDLSIKLDVRWIKRLLLQKRQSKKVHLQVKEQIVLLFKYVQRQKLNSLIRLKNFLKFCYQKSQNILNVFTQQQFGSKCIYLILIYSDMKCD
ncbi:hypothetical protein TTHERM_000144929 (macronuclear) [Tetrahymena thermophila SB210]|uniref:Uncharacterized protein n=1 Tax=Tetrahymena thermophila (strain SB210) TaxID=312017 RepID=W7XL46_TETTS|nr:hypothetical protein TTHERM_000144929 [Tetrahymena thermophila SB210]EWS75654.1 hypothetical protein TTHERM_000144929 [Tetrahymena thermophila SB210]|eukprot:XP_012651800.1 hypothetical protein TTHERM_000144929 [Tetrahymena thermophila SB210]